MSTTSDAAGEAARGNVLKGTQVTVRGDRAVYTVHVPAAPNALDPEVPPTTLFFIHGFGGSCEQFDSQIADMSACVLLYECTQPTAHTPVRTQPRVPRGGV